MWLLLIEALAALAILLFLVWWTMFAGRRRGERESHREGDAAARDPEARPGVDDRGGAPPPG